MNTLPDETRLSSLFLQVIQETSSTPPGDYWGVTAMGYTPHPLENKNLLAARFAEEVERQIPILPFSALGENVDPGLLETFNEGIEHEEISATGLIWNDKLVLQPCYTRHGDYPWGPGEVARYNSINTFILSAAMDAFLKSKEGSDADIWEMVLTDVFRPIGIFYAPIMRTIEPDGSTGFGGNHWVLLPNGVTTFRFCDANKYGVGSMVNVAEALCPFR
jgi:hypothetical protein